MYNSTSEMVEALQATPEVLEALLQGVTQAEAQAARGGEEGWSVVQVMCHLRDAEAFMLERMRALRDQPDAQLTGFDQEAWARERHYETSDWGQAFAAFQQLRAQHVAELAALSPEAWERSGQHNKLGIVTLSNHTLHVVWHDAVHTAQIARQLRH